MDTMLFRNSRRKLSQGLLFWREVGNGIPVILLHGNWCDSSEWVSTMELISRNFHCFAPDLLGFGESEYPNIHYSIDLQVDCLFEFLQALKLDKVYLVGHSLGGWIAASCALKYPEKVQGLILLSPEGVEIEGLQKHWQKMQRLTKSPSLIFKLLKTFRFLARMLKLDAKIEEDLEQRKILLQNPTTTKLLYQRHFPEIQAELLQDKLDLIQIPVLILQGGKDGENALTRSKIYARLTPQAQMKTIAHSGDNLPQKSASLVAEEIRDFIKGHN
ncbi:MAG: alpha/beta hydrolase [Nostocales cyanobacterium 94392]|nr:alpha/beta hydrolase [Nostocales cyanobacterium 94392]